VQISENDVLEIMGDFSPYIRGVRTNHAIGADRVWYVVTREIGD